MKKRIMLAALWTVLFLVPFCAARSESVPAFTVDPARVLSGMDRSLQQGYEPAVNGNRWTLVLPVRSETAVGAVTAKLLTPAGCTSFFRSGEITAVAREEEKGVWGVRFSPSVFPELKNADYPCVIRLTGKDKDGNPVTGEIPYTVRIRGNTAAVEKIRINVREVQGDLSVGEDGEIRVTLANPCAAAEFEDLELKISDAAGHILPRGSESIVVGKMGIGEEITVSYPVTVVEKASVTPHVLKLDLSWTALGQSVSFSVNYTVPVLQEIRLEQGGVRMASSVTAGDSVSLTLPLMNMGKADVVNTLATVTMPGVTERQSVLVGTLQPGETKQAQMILSPSRDLEGSFAGELTVECTDQDGNPSSFTLPLELSVTAPVNPAPVSSVGNKKQAEKTPPAVWVLAGGCVLLLLVLLVQGIVLRRKLHLLEESRL